MRAFNAAHPRDPVRFVGVEYYYTGRPAYDAVEAYVAAHAPRLAAGSFVRDFRVIYPDLRDPVAYSAQYARGAAQGPLHPARPPPRAPGVPGSRTGPGIRRTRLVRQHARQIVSFHEHYALPLDAQDDYRELHARAEPALVAAAHRRPGRLLGGAAAHRGRAAAADRAPAAPRTSAIATTGSHLREWYGEGYVSVGFTLRPRRVGLPPEVTAQPPPDPGWLEAPFGRVDRDAFLVDLDDPAPARRTALAAHPADHPRPALGARIDGHRRITGALVRRTRARAASDPAAAGLSIPGTAQAGEETKEH